MTTGADVLKAALWMSGAIASFTSMAVAGRALSFELDTFEIMMYRSFVGICIVMSVAVATGRLGQVRRDNLGLHLIRNLFHFTGQNLWFYAITVIPLAQVFALEFTSPLWVVVLSPLLLGERITPTRAIAALIGFVGILIVARPGAAPLEFGQAAAAMAAPPPATPTPSTSAPRPWPISTRGASSRAATPTLRAASSSIRAWARRS